MSFGSKIRQKVVPTFWQSIVWISVVFALQGELGWTAGEADYRSPSLVAMDGILDQAQSFRDFAGRPELQTQLFERMSQYMGVDKLPRASFDKVLSQLFELDKRIPGFGEKLWNKRAVESPIVIEYSNDLSAKMYDIHFDAWKETLREMVAGHQENAARLLAMNQTDRTTAIQTLVERVAESVKRFQIRLNSEEKRTRLSPQRIKEIRRRYSSKLAQSQDVKELVSFVVHQRLTASEVTRDRLLNSDASVVLDELTEVQKGYQEAFELPEFKGLKTIPAVLRDSVRDAVPNAQRLVKDPKLFTLPARAEERMVLYQVHRPLYATLRGIYNSECVGGSCERLGTTNPQRTAVPVLDQVEVRFSEVGDSNPFKGFTEVTSVRNRSTGKVHGSVIFGVPRFRNEVMVPDPESGGLVKRRIFDLWLKKATASTPSLAVSRSWSADNAGVQESVRRSLAYQLGTDIGAGTDFEHLKQNEQMVKEIVKHSASLVEPSHLDTYGQRGQLIIDAMLPDAGRLTQLEPISNAELGEKLKKANTRNRLEILRRTMELDPGQKQKYLKDFRFLLGDAELEVRRVATEWMLRAKIQDPAIQPIYLDWLRDEKAPEKLIQYYDRVISKERRLPLLQSLFDSGRANQKKMVISYFKGSKDPLPEEWMASFESLALDKKSGATQEAILFLLERNSQVFISEPKLTEALLNLAVENGSEVRSHFQAVGPPLNLKLSAQQFSRLIDLWPEPKEVPDHWKEWILSELERRPKLIKSLSDHRKGSWIAYLSKSTDSEKPLNILSSILRMDPNLLPTLNRDDLAQARKTQELNAGFNRALSGRANDPRHQEKAARAHLSAALEPCQSQKPEICEEWDRVRQRILSRVSWKTPLKSIQETLDVFRTQAGSLESDGIIAGTRKSDSAVGIYLKVAQGIPEAERKEEWKKLLKSIQTGEGSVNRNIQAALHWVRSDSLSSTAAPAQELLEVLTRDSVGEKLNVALSEELVSGSSELPLWREASRNRARIPNLQKAQQDVLAYTLNSLVEDWWIQPVRTLLKSPSQLLIPREELEALAVGSLKKARNLAEIEDQIRSESVRLQWMRNMRGASVLIPDASDRSIAKKAYQRSFQKMLSGDASGILQYRRMFGFADSSDFELRNLFQRVFSDLESFRKIESDPRFYADLWLKYHDLGEVRRNGGLGIFRAKPEVQDLLIQGFRACLSEMDGCGPRRLGSDSKFVMLLDTILSQEEVSPQAVKELDRLLNEPLVTRRMTKDQVGEIRKRLKGYPRPTLLGGAQQVRPRSRLSNECSALYSTQILRRLLSLPGRR